MATNKLLEAYNKTVDGALCELCAKYDWQSLPVFGLNSSTDIAHLRKGYAHHLSWASLRQSAHSCTMCQMIEHEVLQSLAFRQQKGAPVQTLREDVVEGRGALPITRTVEQQHLDTGKYTRIHLWLEASYHDMPSYINILCPRLLAIDAESKVRFKGRLHSYTDWHESRKRYPSYYDIPRLEVWTSEGNSVRQAIL